MRKVPLPMLADAYTISGEAFAGERAVEKSVYNLTNRISPLDSDDLLNVAEDSRMVFYGLSEFVRRHLWERITHEDIDAAKEFMATAHSFGGPLHFPEKTWRRVVDECHGFLPIRITALPEGSTFFPYEPVVQVESMGKGFGEIAAHIEAVMLGMVSTMSARATICRHWLNRIREEFGRNKYNEYNIGMDELTTDDIKEFDAMARFFIHDFGMRASSCAEESELLGMAHLLVFHGTDTFNAAFAAMERGAERPTGTSILALAHRIVQGHLNEEEAYEAIFGADTNGGIASYVADCYNFHRAVRNHLKAMAQRAAGTIVARPDSGDFYENCLFIAQQAYEAGLHDGAERASATNLRFIQGDSMNPHKVDDVFGGLFDEGFNSVGWGIFGVGGWLRNTSTRDIFSSAYKLCAAGSEDEIVCKLSDTPAKMSVPGKTVLVRDGVACFTGPSVFHTSEVSDDKDARVLYFDPVLRRCNNPDFEGFRPLNESFATISQRTIEEFDSFQKVQPSYGIKGEVDVLSPKLRQFQQDMLDQHQAEEAAV